MKSTAYQIDHAEKHRIFNHDILSCTHSEVAGNHLYSGRALGLTESEDIIQLHPFLKKQWDVITAHYTRIELSHTRQVLWDTSRENMESYPHMTNSVFFFGSGENTVRPDRSWFKIVEHINDKNNFVALASHLRLDVPKTLCFTGKQWFAGIKDFPYPCYVKAAVSVAGKGIFRCENQTDVIKALAYFREDVPLQVQEEVNAETFLNLQYEQTAHGLKRREITEQILDGYTHQGNRYPAQHAPWETVEPMAKWLVEKDMKGVFAFDVAVVTDRHKLRFIPIECNPRFNGASYPSGVARKLGVERWISKEMHTRHRHLSEIDLSGIEFDPRCKTGVILINWGTILVGKLSVLIAGSENMQAQLEKSLAARL